MASGRWTGEPPPKRTFLMNGVVVAGAPSEPPPGSKAEFTNGSCRRSKSSWPPGTGRPQPLFFTPGRQETECVYDSCDAPGATPAEATKRSRERARSTRPCSRAATTDPAGDLFRSIGPTVTLRGRPRRPRPYAFPPDRGGCRARPVVRTAPTGLQARGGIQQSIAVRGHPRGPGAGEAVPEAGGRSVSRSCSPRSCCAIAVYAQNPQGPAPPFADRAGPVQGGGSIAMRRRGSRGTRRRTVRSPAQRQASISWCHAADGKACG